MNFFIKRRISLLIPCYLSLIVCCNGQNYRFEDDGTVSVHNSSLTLHMHTTVSLPLLYSMTKDQRNDYGITSFFDSNIYGEDGIVEVRVYDFDDESKQVGNLLFGCKSTQSGYHGESWDAQSYYQHWYSWKKHHISSADIKFLSQHEHVGSICPDPPASFWQRKGAYRDIGLIAGEFVVVGGLFTLSVLSAGIATPFAVGLVIASSSAAVYALYDIHDKEVQESVEFQQYKAKIDKWKLKFQDENGDWCQVATPAPKVIVELKVTNANVTSVTIPGIGTLSGSQFLPGGTYSSMAHTLNMEKVSANVPRNLSADNSITDAVPNALSTYPLPTEMVVPKSPEYIGWVDMPVPTEGRILVIATRQRMKDLETGINLQDAWTPYIIGPVMFSKSANNPNPDKPNVYYLYSVIADPGARIYFEVNEFGPFLAGYDFELINRVTPPLELMLDALDNPHKYPNYVMVAAHRGYWRNAPENSLEAINDCIDFGVDMVEIDVRKTQDGKLVMAHDVHLGRLTTEPAHLEPKRDANGHILVSNLTLCEIRPDLCGDNTTEPVRLKHHDGTPAEPMPTFKEVLELCKDRVIVDVDKIEGFFYEVFQDAEATGTTHQVVVKGRFETPDNLLDLAKVPNTNLIDWHKLRFTPVYFSDFGFADYGASINAFLTDTRLNVPGVELIYRNDADPLLQYRTTIQQHNDRVFQFPQYPENCEGVFNPKKFIYSDIDPRTDFRNDYEWLLAPSRKPDLLISDRLEILMHILDIRGMRDITKVNPN